MKVVKIVRTCFACPEQYEGELSNGEKFYVRCRWGHARLGVSPNSVDEAVHAKPISEIYYDDDIQGVFDAGDLKKLFEQVNIELDESIITEYI